MPSSGAPSSGGSFRVDLDEAPQAIKDLEAARQELLSIKDQARALGKVDAGSADSVSLDAARRLSEVAVYGPTSLVYALDAGIAEIDRLISAMVAELRDYRTVESENVAKTRS